MQPRQPSSLAIAAALPLNFQHVFSQSVSNFSPGFLIMSFSTMARRQHTQLTTVSKMNALQGKVRIVTLIHLAILRMAIYQTKCFQNIIILALIIYD